MQNEEKNYQRDKLVKGAKGGQLDEELLKELAEVGR